MENLEQLVERLERIEKELAAIASLLRRLPEIQAAVYLQMKEEYAGASLFRHQSAKDLWEVCPPNLR